jgi:alpha-1,6-mannosyltransferase
MMRVSDRLPRDKQAAVLCLAALAVGLSVLTAMAPTLHRQLGGWALIVAFAACGLGAYAAARLGDIADQRQGLVIVLVGAIAMRLALLFVEPYLSSDIYRYIWDGRVQAAGINPYRYVPKAPELAALRDSVIWPNINRPDYAVTIYPPVAQAIYFIVTRVSESVVAMKLGLIVFEAGTVAAIIGLLQRQDAPVTRVAAYAWHPLPVWEIAGNGHVDAAMVALLFTGLLLFLRGRVLVAGVIVALGALVKPLPLLALPVFWRPWRWRLPVVVVLTILFAYLPYLSVGMGVVGFLPGYINEEGLASGTGYKLLWLLEQLTGALPYGGIMYVLVCAATVVSLAIAVGFRADRSEEAALWCLSWLLVTFLVLFSPHYPWYFLVLVPLLALKPSATAWVLTIGGVLLYDVVGNDTLPRYEVRFTVFTLATLAAVAHDLWHDRRRSIALAAGETP